MHEQDPVGPARSFPPGVAPALPSSESEVAESGVAESGVVWRGRRTLRTGERVLVGVGAVFLAGYLSLLVVSADWAGHPLFSGLAAICAVSAVVTLVASAWVRRPNHRLVQGWTMRRLPRVTRRRLVRGLRAGELGPPELCSWAAYWSTLTLQAPWNPALFLALAANNAGLVASPGPVETWRLVVLAVFLVLVVITVVGGGTRRRAAHRIADLLDQQPAAAPLAPPGARGA